MKPKKQPNGAKKMRLLSKKAKPVVAFAAPDRLIMCSMPDADCGRTQAYLVLPLPTKRAALAKKKWEGLSYGDKVEAMAKAGYMDDVGFRRGEPRWEEYASESPENAICETWRSRAHAILALTGEPSP